MMRLIIVVLCGLLVTADQVKAEQAALAPILNVDSVNKGYVALDYTYFSESLDVFDYASKLNSTFKPKDAASFYGSMGFKPVDGMLLSYQREQTRASTIRDREPFEVESDVKGNALLLQWLGGEFLGHQLQVLAGYNARSQDDLTIACYAYSGLTVGACDNADLSFSDPVSGDAVPAVITSAEEDRWQFGLLFNRQFGNGITMWHRLRFFHSDIDTSTESAFLDLDDPFLLGIRFNGETLGDTIDRLKQTFPQEAPWSERTLRYDLGLNLPLGDRWLVTGELGFLSVNRSDYDRYEGVPDYDSNVLLNAAAWYTPSENIAVYARAELYKHYLLGIDPMIYNQRTSKFFEHPYAQISAGLLFRF